MERLEVELLTREEAAKKLRVGLRTLDRRIESGDLKCYRYGEGRHAPVRISLDQINDFLLSMRNTKTYRTRAREIMSAKQQ